MTLYVRSSSRSHCMTILPHWRWRWFKSRRPWTKILSEGFVSPCSPQHCVGPFAGIMKLRSISIYIAISISIVVSCCIYNNTIYHIISYYLLPYVMYPILASFIFSLRGFRLLWLHLRDGWLDVKEYLLAKTTWAVRINGKSRRICPSGSFIGGFWSSKTGMFLKKTLLSGL